jgi:hypothetical protein
MRSEEWRCGAHNFEAPRIIYFLPCAQAAAFVLAVRPHPCPQGRALTQS